MGRAVSAAENRWARQRHPSSVIPAADPDALNGVLAYLGIPPRTHFYSLEARGEETMLVEGLTSYFVTLASVHGVTPAKLIKQEAAQLGNIPLTNGNQSLVAGNEMYFDFKSAHTLNGWGPATSGLVSALQTGTGKSNLANLTLLRFQSALSEKRLFCIVNRWCVLCYNAWRISHSRIYEPLIWSIDVVDVCPEHGVPLKDRCAACGSQSSPVTGRSLPELCPNCHASLFNEREVEGLLRMRADEKALWRARQIGDLLTRTIGRDPVDLSRCLRKNLTICIKASARGDVKELKRLCGVEAGELVCRHELKQLLNICDRLDTSLSSLFSPRFALPSRVSVVIEEPVQKEAQHRPRDENAVHMLENALKESPAISLAEVARRMGRHDPHFLTCAAPELAARVSARYRKGPRQNPRSHYGMGDPAVKRSIKKRLESSLASDSRESNEDIAVKLGHKTIYGLTRDFPALCNAISEKNKKLAQKYWEEVEAQLQNAASEEPPPTMNQLARRIQAPTGTLKRKFPGLVSQILERARSKRASAIVELRRRKLVEMLPFAHTMTLQEALKKMKVCGRVLREQLPREYALLRKRVRNRRHEAAVERRKRLDQFVLDQVRWNMRRGHLTTLNEIHAVLPADYLRGNAAVGAAFEAAKKKLAESGLEDRLERKLRKAA